MGKSSAIGDGRLGSYKTEILRIVKMALVRSIKNLAHSVADHLQVAPCILHNKLKSEGDTGVPILLYHKVLPVLPKLDNYESTVSVASFERQMMQLCELGYQTIGTEKLRSWMVRFVCQKIR